MNDLKCVYKHLDNNGKVFYIGCGHPDRAHNKIARTDIWKGIANKGYSVEIVDVLPELEAKDLERSLIKQYGLENLTNGCNVWNEEEKEHNTKQGFIKVSIDLPQDLYDEIQKKANEKMMPWNTMARILWKNHLDWLDSQKLKK